MLSWSSVFETLLQWLLGLWLGAALIALHRHGARKKDHEPEEKEKGRKKQGKLLHRSHSTGHMEMEHAEDLRTAQNEARWLDRMMEVLWPRASVYLKHYLQDEVGPAIARALPRVLRSQVRFEEVTLGDTAPAFGPLFVEETENQGILLRLGVKMETKMKVNLRVLGTRIGVSKLHLHGDLFVTFRPPKARPPFFGGLQIYFANPPILNFHFNGVAKLAECPGIRNIVRSTIANAIEHALVLPHRIAVDMDEEDDEDYLDLQCPEPVAVLRVTLLRAHNLIASDFSFFGPASSDPFVVATLGSTRWTSPVVKQNLNPVWGQDGQGVTADFVVHSYEQKLRLEVWDKDDFTPSDFIGSARDLTLSQISSGEEVQVPLTLEVPGKREGPAGHLVLSGKILRLTLRAPEVASGPSVGVLTVKLKEVTGLPSTGLFPFKVEVTLGEQKISSYASSAKASKPVPKVLVDLGAKLLQKGFDPDKISRILQINRQEVETIISQDPAKQAQAKAAANQQAAMNPQFNHIMQVLVPLHWNPTTYDGDVDLFLGLKLLDRRGKTVGSAHVTLTELSNAPGLKLTRPHRLEPTSALLHCTMRLHWLSEEDVHSPSASPALSKRVSVP